MPEGDRPAQLTFSAQAALTTYQQSLTNKPRALRVRACLCQLEQAATGVLEDKGRHLLVQIGGASLEVVRLIEVAHGGGGDPSPFTSLMAVVFWVIHRSPGLLLGGGGDLTCHVGR